VVGVVKALVWIDCSDCIGRTGCKCSVGVSSELS
jgi:hypothetical protein